MRFDCEAYPWAKLENLARHSERINCSKHSACLMYKGHIVAHGVAKKKTHPLMKKFSGNEKKIYLHAEIDCIISAINKYGVEFLSECSLFVLRITRGGFVGMSKPCPVCEKAINSFGIKGVHWTKNGEEK